MINRRSFNKVLSALAGSAFLSACQNNSSKKTPFYKGDVILKEYTDKKIIINFKGEGFPVGSNIKKDKLFPMEGSIVIEDYNIYDGRL